MGVYQKAAWDRVSGKPAETAGKPQRWGKTHANTCTVKTGTNARVTPWTRKDSTVLFKYGDGIKIGSFYPAVIALYTFF